MGNSQKSIIIILLDYAQSMNEFVELPGDTAAK